MLSTPNGWTLTVFLPTANTTEVIMSVYSQVEKAEEAIRQSLINALAEGDDQHLTDLFNLLSSIQTCLLYTSPSPRDGLLSRMPSSA